MLIWDWIKFTFQIVSKLVENELVTICFMCLPHRYAFVPVPFCIISIWNILFMSSINWRKCSVYFIAHSRSNTRHMETISELKIRNIWMMENFPGRNWNQRQEKNKNQMNSILLAISNCFDRRYYFIAARASFYHGQKKNGKKENGKKVKNYSHQKSTEIVVIMFWHGISKTKIIFFEWLLVSSVLPGSRHPTKRKTI